MLQLRESEEPLVYFILNLVVQVFYVTVQLPNEPQIFEGTDSWKTFTSSVKQIRHLSRFHVFCSAL